MRRSVSLFIGGLLLVACTAEPAAVTQVPSPGSTGDVLQPDDTVDLTLYFRSGDGHNAHLEAVTREVGMDEDLPRRALELLLAGPGGGEQALDAPLPAGIALEGLRVEGGTAHVELSEGALPGVTSRAAGDEALALAAIANTLTEFPSIDTVTVTVEGMHDDRDGHSAGWGVPPLLVRDESLIGPSLDGEGLLDLSRFAAAAQTTGWADAEPVEVTAVRVRDRLTHVRVAVELSGVGGDGTAKVPDTRTRLFDDELLMVIDGVAAYTAAFGDGRALELSSSDFRELHVEHAGGAVRLRLSVDGASTRPFWLHTLSSPTRIVLDVKK